MLTLMDRPLIQFAVDTAREAGIEEFVSAAEKGALEDYFDTRPRLAATFLKARFPIVLITWGLGQGASCSLRTRSTRKCKPLA
jgi:hypothetical protein